MLSIKMVYSGARFSKNLTKILRSFENRAPGVLFILFCTVNWLDVEGLKIEVGGLRGLPSDLWGFTICAPSHFNHCDKTTLSLVLDMNHNMFKILIGFLR